MTLAINLSAVTTTMVLTPAMKQWQQFQLALKANIQEKIIT
jgi:hypothetical protein